MAIRPVTAAGVGITGALGIGQAIAGGLVGRKARKENQARIDELLEARAAGTLGKLSGTQKRVMEQRLVDPIRQTAGEARQRSEAAAAATGALAASDLGRLRREETAAVGQAGQAAQTQILGAEQASVERATQELEDRISLGAQQKRQMVSDIFSPLAQAAGVAGQMAGAVPEALRATGLYGIPRPVTDPTALVRDLRQAGFSDANLQALLDFELSNPGGLNRAVRGMQGQAPAVRSAQQFAAVRPGAPGRVESGLFDG